MIWVHYGEQDYMDPMPSDGYRLFESMEQAREWADHMKRHYTGGDTWIIGPARQKDILHYIEVNKIDLSEDTLKNINNKEYYHPLYAL